MRLSGLIVIHVFSLLEFEACVFFPSFFPYFILTWWRAPGRQAADEIPKPLDKSHGQDQWRGRVWCKFPSVWKHCLPHLTQLIRKLSLTSINSPTLVSSHSLSVLRETRGWHYWNSVIKRRSVQTLRPYTVQSLCHCSHYTCAIYECCCRGLPHILTLCEGNENWLMGWKLGSGWILLGEIGGGEYVEPI